MDGKEQEKRKKERKGRPQPRLSSNILDEV
jgi:hypothetical protein